ncbi:MAG: response regulator [Clostridia bacterium]|nr:response regulator [Clostridia bacterium]
MEKVLLVNDSKFESLIMKDMLGLLGYNVEIADEYTALRKLETFKPQVIIVNYIMKEIRGDQLIGIVKLQNPGVKCVLFSSDLGSIEEFSKRKVDAVFQTPVEKSKLEKVLNELSVDGSSAPIDKKEYLPKVRRVIIEDDDVEILEEKTYKAELRETLQKNSGSYTGVNKAEEPINVKVAFCTQCGYKLDGDGGKVFLFCPYCGNKL